MTFLEKIKAKRAAEAEAVSQPANNTAASVKEPEEEKPKSSLKGILARRKAAEAAKAAKAVETIAPTEEKVVTEEITPKDKPADKEEKVKEAPAEEKETVKDEPKETVKDEPKETVKDESKEKTEDEQPKKKKKVTRRKSKNTADDNSADNESEDTQVTFLSTREFEVQNVLGTKMSYEEMVAKYESAFEDEGWMEFRAEIVKELDAIKVAADMNPGTLKVTLTELNDLYGKIAVEHSRMKALLESLANKEDGVCTAIRYQGMPEGSNDNVRRANGYAALNNATFQGEPINFVNLIAGTRMKYTFLDSIVQRINFMSRMCITFLGALKMENSMDAIVASR